MLILYSGAFYDKDYFENGRQSGKGWLENYRWMPRRSFREAFAYIDTMGLDDNSRVLDFGCAKGYIVRALRELGITADGCDISPYAIWDAPQGCWHSGADVQWTMRKGAYTHVIAKDVFEHLEENQLREMLTRLQTMANQIMCVVPLGDNGLYRIPVYHHELSHILIHNESWWRQVFESCGWRVLMATHRIQGLKDNWAQYPTGNYFIWARHGAKE